MLHRLVSTALRENRDVLTAIATIQEFRAQLGIARGQLLPQLYGNARGGTNKVVFAGGSPVSFDIYSVTANLSWELDFWGRLRRGTEAARADLLSREEGERAVVLSLISDVAGAYLQLRELDLDLEISQRALASRTATLRLARRRYEQGLISELDVQRSLYTADLAAAQAERQELAAAVQLYRALGGGWAVGSAGGARR